MAYENQPMGVLRCSLSTYPGGLVSPGVHARISIATATASLYFVGACRSASPERGAAIVSRSR